jgi:hypothetical protein
MNASQLIDNRIAELGGWRGETLARLRKLILSAVPWLVEEWKWDTPVWSNNGNVVAAGAFKDYLKINFFEGALLDDPAHLFNAGLEAKASRAIDIHENDKINEAALKNLIRSAAELNTAKPKKSIKTPIKKSKKKAASAK